jgi:hypothetical protein
MIKRLATKTKSARENKASDRSNPSRNPKSDRQASMPQGQAPKSQATELQQMQQMQQMQPQMYGRDSYGQQPMMPSQYTVDQFLPWQMQGMQSSMHGGSGVYNSGQFFSSPGQNLPRTANVLQTLMQGNTGECP